MSGHPLAGRRPVVVFDLDGTLFDGEISDWLDAAHVRAAVRPNAPAVAFAWSLHAAGARVVYVTGRGSILGDVTREQAARWLPPGIVRDQDSFTGFDAMRRFKAGELLTWRASLAVGDHEQDRAAAQEAGVAFLHARSIRQTELPPAADFERVIRLAGVRG